MAQPVGKLWTLYAQTNPRVIWVEDDIRTFNHWPATLSCFCEEHMRRFSAMVGEKVDREKLVAAIFAPGKPHPWRKVWLDLQAEVMIDTVNFLREAVQAASPQTSLGLMSSGPENHCVEGRDWHRFARAMGGKNLIFSRPTLGNYNEDSVRGLWYSAHSIKHTRCAMLPEAVELTEVENWPFTQYSKSATFTAMQMAVCVAYGAHGLTLNLYDHIGTPLAENPSYGAMLARWKPYLNSLSGRCRMPEGSPAAPCAGVRLLHNNKSGYSKVLAGESHAYCLGQDGHAWNNPLEAMGFPSTCDSSCVTALSGQAIRAFSKEEIAAILSQGVLIDAGAAQILCELGFSADIGVEVERIEPKDNFPLAAEELTHPGFAGRPGRYVTMTLPDLFGGMRLAFLKRDPKAVAISRVVDADCKEFMAYATIFENARGGRVAVLPIIMEPGRFLSMLNPARKEQFSAILHWLAKGRLPLEATAWDGVYPLAHRRDFPGRSMVGAFNLSLDPWGGVTFDLYAGDKEIAGVDALSLDGVWGEAKNLVIKAGKPGRLSLEISQPVSFDTPVALEVRWR